MKTLKQAFAAALIALVAWGPLAADTTTSRWGLTKPDIGSTNWGPKLNTNSDTIDDAAGQGKTNTFTGSNTFNGTTTIGAGSSSSLTISTNVTLSNTPNITGNANINTSSVTATNLSYTTGVGSTLTLSTITVSRTATLSTATVSGYVSASSVTATNFSASNINAATMAANLIMASHKLTGLSAGSTAGDSVRFEQNKVVQWVFATQSVSTTTTGANFVETGLTANITPTSSSNKILIIATGDGRYSGTNLGNQGLYTIARGGTSLTGSSLGLATLVPQVSGQSLDSGITMVYVDNPASTSSLTYSVQFRSASTSNTLTWSVSSSLSTIILVELAP